MKYWKHFLINFTLLFIFVLGASSCNNTKKKENKSKVPAVTVNYQPGKVIKHITCSSDTTESYALYLPSNYNPARQFPVVFFFDAHARGALVVEKYKKVAEAFDFILAASNNSKNGQPPKIMNEILYHFMQDVEQRFSVDPNRIYTAGFSGGARIAAGIGLFNKSVAGTIGMEAGFPPIQQIPDTHLAWVGIVGNTDFNYLEMKNLSQQLDAAGIHNLLLIYPGKHQLPPAKEFKKAYEFLLLEAMRKKTISVNQVVIDSVKNQYNQARLMAIKQNNCMSLIEADQLLVKNLEGLINVSKYQKEIKTLSSNPVCKLRKKEINALMETEAYYQRVFSRSMTTEGAGWWRHQIQEIYRKKSVTRDKRVKLMYQRLLNYLSLTSYIYAKGSIENKQMNEANKFLMIYQMVDPENPEVYFMKAEYYAIENNNAKALSSLRAAINHGFKDFFRIENNRYFKDLKSLPQFKSIVALKKDKKQSL